MHSYIRNRLKKGEYVSIPPLWTPSNGSALVCGRATVGGLTYNPFQSAALLVFQL
jgi:hypothetical protein